MKQRQIFEATLRVTLDGTGCKLCPALRYRMADETRFCSEVGGTLLNWKTERSSWCPLIDIEEKKSIMNTEEE